MHRVGLGLQVFCVAAGPAQRATHLDSQRQWGWRLWRRRAWAPEGGGWAPGASAKAKPGHYQGGTAQGMMGWGGGRGGAFGPAGARCVWPARCAAAWRARARACRAARRAAACAIRASSWSETSWRCAHRRAWRERSIPGGSRRAAWVPHTVERGSLVTPRRGSRAALRGPRQPTLYSGVQRARRAQARWHLEP